MSGVRAEAFRENIVGLAAGPDYLIAPLARALAACGELAGASAATLLSVDPSSPRSVIVHSGDLPRIDVASPAIRAAVERQAALMFSAGPAWIDDGTDSTMVARVAGAGRVTYVLALSFATASVVARARVARLLPTLAALIAAQLDAEGELAALKDRHSACVLALEHSDCGIIAVYDDHSILFANAAATTMLADGAGLHVKRGVVRPIDYRYAARFEAALDAVQDGRGTGRPGRETALVMLLPGSENARPLVIAVVPAGADSVSARGASALIYLFKPDAHPVAGLETIAELHGLSGVERRLLAQLYSGLTVAEAAEHLRIKLETARAYLKQIFAKTGTHRQTELVALMTRYLRPMRGDFEFKPA